jgi:hypothetical protein
MRSSVLYIMPGAAIRTLLELGANADVVDAGMSGWTALVHAIHKNQAGAGTQGR